MKTVITAFLLSSSVGFAAAQIAPPDASDNLEALADAANSAWVEAYTAGNVDELVGMHAEDTVILSPNGSIFEGLEGARAYYTLAIGFAPHDRSITIKERTVRQYGDLIIQNATWDMKATTPDNTPIALSGRSSIVALKTPEGWFIVDYHPAINPPPQN